MIRGAAGSLSDLRQKKRGAEPSKREPVVSGREGHSRHLPSRCSDRGRNDPNRGYI